MWGNVGNYLLWTKCETCLFSFKRWHEYAGITQRTSVISTNLIQQVHHRGRPPEHEQNSAFCLFKWIISNRHLSPPADSRVDLLDHIRTAAQMQTQQIEIFRIATSVKTTCWAGCYHPTTLRWLDIPTGLSMDAQNPTHDNISGMTSLPEPTVVTNSGSRLQSRCCAAQTRQKGVKRAVSSPPSCSRRHSRPGRLPPSISLWLGGASQPVLTVKNTLLGLEATLTELLVASTGAPTVFSGILLSSN